MCSIMTGACNLRTGQDCGCSRLHSIKQCRAAGKQGYSRGPDAWICPEKVFKRILIRNIIQLLRKLWKQIRNVRQRIRNHTNKNKNIIKLTRKSNEKSNTIEKKSKNSNWKRKINKKSQKKQLRFISAAIRLIRK